MTLSSGEGEVGEDTVCNEILCTCEPISDSQDDAEIVKIF